MVRSRWRGAGAAVLRITPSITVRPAGVGCVYHVKSGSPPGWGPGTEVNAKPRRGVTALPRATCGWRRRWASGRGRRVRRARRRGSSRHRRSGRRRTDRGARHPTGAQHLVEVEQRLDHRRRAPLPTRRRRWPSGTRRNARAADHRRPRCARSRAAGWPRSAGAEHAPEPVHVLAVGAPPCRGPGPHDGALGAGDVVRPTPPPARRPRQDRTWRRHCPLLLPAPVAPHRLSTRSPSITNVAALVMEHPRMARFHTSSPGCADSPCAPGSASRPCAVGAL